VTGGYRSSSVPNGRTKQLFIRWAQLGAFCPLMENGGNGEHRPWMFDSNNQTLDIYRNFVNIHMELVLYRVACTTV
jgi:alpha-glucosidase (family GH31 glycosyl hydrolase)